MQRKEENEVRAVGDMRVPGKRPRGDQEGDGWMASEPKGDAGTADHPGGCTGQNILEIKNSGR